jgi:hypothetical protein
VGGNICVCIEAGRTVAGGSAQPLDESFGSDSLSNDCKFFGLLGGFFFFFPLFFFFSLLRVTLTLTLTLTLPPNPNTKAERHGHQWDGGKKDDITVMVAMVDAAPGIAFKRSDGTPLIAGKAASNVPNADV